MPGQAGEAAVRRIAELLPHSRTVEELIEGVETDDIETSLADFPDALSDSLTLIAIAIARIEKPGGFISNGEMSERVKDSATLLCLEWLQRKKAITYDFPLGDRITWQAAPCFTSAFVDALKSRHETLYRFALELLVTRSSWRN